jgi:hypothetical protein
MGRKAKSEEDKKGKVSITVSNTNYQAMEGINKSQLINWLLVEYFKTLIHGK